MKFLSMLLAMSLCFPAYARTKTIELVGENTLMLSFEIRPDTADVFVHAIIAKRGMLPKDKTMYILIASPGGDIESAKLIKEVLKNVPNTAVICKFCASAASMIFATFPGPRYSIEKTEVLMHEMYYGHLTAKQATPDAMISLIIASEEFNKMIYDVIGISKEKYEKKIVGKEWIVYGDDTVDLHLSTKFVKVHCDAYVKDMAPDTCTPKDDE